MTFGGVEAEVLFKNEDEIHVLSPPGCSPGNVEIDVEVPGFGSDEITFEFETWATGQDVAVVGVVRSEHQGLGTAVEGLATAEFFTPALAPPFSSLPALGTCVLGPTIASSNRPNYSLGSTVSLSAGGTPITFQLDPADNSYSADGITDAQIPTSAIYGLNGGQDPDGCAVDVPGIIYSPDPLYVTNPNMSAGPCVDSLTMCWFYEVDTSGLYANGGVVQWVSGSDAVIVQMDFVDYYNDNPTTWPASLLCHVPDNGTLNLSQSDFQGMYTGLYQLTVIRYRTTEGSHPRSGGTVYGTFMETKIGYSWLLANVSACLSLSCP